MTDFFGNLFLRSNPSAKTSAAILQPRLPSLFESTRGADEIPSPRPDAVVRESFSPGSAHPAEHGTKEDADLPGHASTVTAHIPENHPEPKQKNNLRVIVSEKDARMFAPPEAHEKPLPSTPNKTQEALTKALNQTIIPINDTRQAAVSDARPPDQLPVHVEREVTFSAQPTGKTDITPGTQENRQTPQMEIRSVKSEESDGNLPVQNRPAEYTLQPHLEPAAPQPILKPVLTPQPISVVSQGVAAQPQQAQEHESVVEIHIGRIEVRALTPPTPPPAVRAALSKPKMSLDDYLLRREEKR